MKAHEDFLTLGDLAIELEALKAAAAGNDLDALRAVLRKCVKLTKLKKIQKCSHLGSRACRRRAKLLRGKVKATLHACGSRSWIRQKKKYTLRATEAWSPALSSVSHSCVVKPWVSTKLDMPKLRSKLGWVPEFIMQEMRAEMVAHNLAQLKPHAILKVNA